VVVFIALSWTVIHLVYITPQLFHERLPTPICYFSTHYKAFKLILKEGLAILLALLLKNSGPV
jgi:hypothetical protein